MILMALNIPVAGTSYETAILMQIADHFDTLYNLDVILLLNIYVTWRVWKSCGKINMLKCCSHLPEYIVFQLVRKCSSLN